jgi:hypothetical protein
LREGTFGCGSRSSAVERSEGIIEQGLQACLEAAQEKRDENGKGQNPLPSEVSI